ETLKPGSEAWKSADRYDIHHLLRQGDNYFVVQATNTDGKGGVLSATLVRTVDGNLHSISTDSSWQAALDPGPNWQSTAEGGQWQLALDYGPAATVETWRLPVTASELESILARTKITLENMVIPCVSVAVDPSTTAAISGWSGQKDKFHETIVDARKPGQKAVFLVDFGREVVGYPMLMGNAYTRTKVQVACGEYEAECDAPFQSVIKRELGPGGIRWAPIERRAFRYAKFTVEPERAVKIDRFQAEVVEYPVQETGGFECSDTTLNAIWEASRRTLRACMQDYYEDGIKRDRTLRAGDLRVGALVNYYVFGDQALALRSLIQLANFQHPDGAIPVSTVQPGGSVAPDYCAFFVIALADYYRFTGDLGAVKLLYPYARKQMQWFEAGCDENGLFRHADREGWSLFVDWDDTLEKRDAVTATEALYYKALADAMELASVTGNKADHRDYLNRAAALKSSANSLLWSEGLGAYIDCAGDGGPSVLAHRQSNALAILAGLAEPEMARGAAMALFDATKTPPVTTPYMNFYVASALFEQGCSNEGIELVRSYWGAMIDRGATTFWEKFDPRWETPYEKPELSYCHGWSSGPGMLLPAYVAGIRPMMTGFEQVIIEPELGELSYVKATVPSPKGTVEVDLRADRGRPVGTIALPKNCTGLIRLRPAPEGSVYTIDGRRVGYKSDGQKIFFKLRGGTSYELGLK
ncbi:MAG: hypothetical protein A2Z18_03835, partial [Armatimonadetes bacterium RBG_16_58_9]